MLFVVGCFLGTIIYLIRQQYKRSQPTFALSPAKRLSAEQSCKKRLRYEERRRKCTKKSGDKEDLCLEDLEKKLSEAVHLELIRGAESIEEALAIEQAYRGRPLTAEEKLAVTAETMFDEYELRSNR